MHESGVSQGGGGTPLKRPGFAFSAASFTLGALPNRPGGPMRAVFRLLSALGVLTFSGAALVAQQPGITRQGFWGAISFGYGHSSLTSSNFDFADSAQGGGVALDVKLGGTLDRKSTRLNSSHLVISYAVFCLKKKKKKEELMRNAAATPS